MQACKSFDSQEKDALFHQTKPYYNKEFRWQKG